MNRILTDLFTAVPSREWLEFEGGVISALFQQSESALARRWRSRHENGYHKVAGGGSRRNAFRWGRLVRSLGSRGMKDNESPMAYRSINLVTGRQLRAARTLAGMTQRDLATVLAVNERAVRFWERKHDRRPTSAPNDTRIEEALLARGVILFAEPTPGARLAEKR
jgi:DNA-binding XRE family transcriptional regulator